MNPHYQRKKSILDLDLHINENATIVHETAEHSTFENTRERVITILNLKNKIIEIVQQPLKPRMPMKLSLSLLVNLRS